MYGVWTLCIGVIAFSGKHFLYSFCVAWLMSVRNKYVICTVTILGTRSTVYLLHVLLLLLRMTSGGGYIGIKGQNDQSERYLISSGSCLTFPATSLELNATCPCVVLHQDIG